MAMRMMLLPVGAIIIYIDLDILNVYIYIYLFMTSRDPNSRQNSRSPHCLKASSSGSGAPCLAAAVCGLPVAKQLELHFDVGHRPGAERRPPTSQSPSKTSPNTWASARASSPRSFERRRCAAPP